MSEQMFLEHAGKLGFFKAEAEDGIFSGFPVAARRTLAKTTASSLLVMKPHPDQITTVMHLRTLMEVVGQAFLLPMEEDGESIVGQALDLYRLWLLNEQFQPKPFRDESQWFITNMLRHSSMIFTPRRTGLDQQVALCSRTLEIHLEVSCELAPVLEVSTWEDLLRVNLATADSLLHIDMGDTELAAALQVQMLRTLYELWLRSGTQNEELWGTWRNLMQFWRHRKTTIEVWSAVLYGLTQRVIGITYGKDIGSALVVIEIEEEKVEVELDDDHVLYCWYKVLHMLGDLESIEDPDIYQEAMRGLSYLTSSLMTVEHRLKSKPDIKPPDGNSILHALGPHLMEALTTFPREFDAGKSVVLETVCKLFLRKGKTTVFHARYLGLFYHGLEASLKSGSNYLLGVVMINCIKLFASEFRGVRLLIPTFVAALEKVLTTPNTLSGIPSNMAVLRRAGLQLLSELLCWSNRYGSTTFKARDPLRSVAEELPPIVAYSDLTPHFEYIFTRALDAIEEPDNKELLLSCAFTFLVENLAAPNFNYGVRFIKDVLARLSVATWPLPVILASLRFLSDLSTFHRQMDAKEMLPQRVVNTMCSLIEMHVSSKDSSRPPPPELICAALFVMHRWATPQQYLFKSQDLLSRVCRTIDLCLVGGPEVHEPSDDVQETALYVFLNLLNHTGHQADTEFLESRQSERDVLKELGLDDSALSCFIFDGSLISVIQHPKRANDVSVTVIVRSVTGRNCWRFSANYFPREVVQVAPFEAESAERLPQLPEVVRLSEQTMQQLEQELSAEARRKHEVVVQEVLRRVARLEEVRAELAALPMPSALQRLQAAPYAEGRTETVARRMFMSTLGYLSLANRSRLHWVPHADVPKFLESCKPLDTMQGRESFYCSVAYVGWDAEFDLSFRGGSEAFFRFVNALGWQTTLSAHPEWGGPIEEEQYAAAYHDPAVRFFGDLDTSLLVLPLPMFAEEAEPEALATVFEQSQVVVVWCEDASDFRPLNKAPFTIAIQPFPTGVFLVRLLQTGARKSLPGPMVDGALVSAHVLPTLVRVTALNLLRSLVPDYRPGHSFLKRKDALGQIIQQHVARRMHFTPTYAAQFAPDNFSTPRKATPV